MLDPQKFNLSYIFSAGWSLAPFTVQIFDTAFGVPVFAFTGIVTTKLILDGITRPMISTFIDRPVYLDKINTYLKC